MAQRIATRLRQSIVRGELEPGASLHQAELATEFHISPASDKEPGDLAEPIKRQVSMPVIAVGNMDDPNRAAAALKRRRADLIAVGRGLIADPDWANKLKNGAEEESTTCVRCNEKCLGNPKKGIPVACSQGAD